ncbi:hypothetical protein [Pseudofrankia sp. DC12]|uniref:hypothetical protein n=1 Tax=Pseudofrankia sp. DC12 TaxID=683315 RepID=UPI0005F886D1|nr:hypothetical protein [Pseudofrankia sp. DC12]
MFTLGVVLLVIAGGLTADIVLESNDVTQVALFGHEFAFDNWRLFVFGLLTGVLTVIALQLMLSGLVRGGRRRKVLRVQRRELAAVSRSAGSTVPQATAPTSLAPTAQAPTSPAPAPVAPAAQPTAPARPRSGRRSTDGTLVGSGRAASAGTATGASAAGPAPVAVSDDSATGTMPFRRFRGAVGKPAGSDGVVVTDRGDAVPAQSSSRTGAAAVYPTDRPKDRVVARARSASDTVGQDTVGQDTVGQDTVGQDTVCE